MKTDLSEMLSLKRRVGFAHLQSGGGVSGGMLPGNLWEKKQYNLVHFSLIL